MTAFGIGSVLTRLLAINLDTKVAVALLLASLSGRLLQVSADRPNVGCDLHAVAPVLPR